MIIIIVLLILLLMHQILNILFNHSWMKNLTADLRLSDNMAIEGQKLSLYETVTNRKWMPLLAVQVKFMVSRNLLFEDNNNSMISDQYYRNDMLTLMMYQRVTRTLTFQCARRGYYTINQICVVCCNLFMTSEKLANFDQDISLYVYPKLVDYARIEVPFYKMLGTVLTKRFINEDPFEFRSIREYQSYDNLKSVNWKASAKTGSLKVNVNDYTSSQKIKILINIENEGVRVYEDLQEESIRIAATLAVEFIKLGIEVSVFTNAKDIITNEILDIPAGCGKNHIRSLMESLSRIDTTLNAESFVATVNDKLINQTDNDYIIIISSYQKEDLQSLLLEQLEAHKDFSWFIPTNNEVKLHVSNKLMPQVVTWDLVS